MKPAPHMRLDEAKDVLQQLLDVNPWDEPDELSATVEELQERMGRLARYGIVRLELKVDR